MSAAVALCYSGATAFHGVVRAPHRGSVVMETKAEMVELAKQLNPVVGYWDPLKLADANLWGTNSEEVSTGPLRPRCVRLSRSPLPVLSSPSAGFASRS